MIIENKDTGDINSVPAEDISFLILDSKQISITTHTIDNLLQNGAGVMFCGDNHHPSGIANPISGNFSQTLKIAQQSKVKKPLLKQLWKRIIRQKINNQATLLHLTEKIYAPLKEKAKRVKSGDKGNMEGQAARYYWKQLFGKEFIRDRDGEPPNHLLNYGYSIIRAIVARSIVATGLHPSLGIHHKNQFNAFCLADDLMEPYRPFVDQLVYDLYDAENIDFALSKEDRNNLLSIIHQPVRIKAQGMQMINAIQETANSYYNSIDKENNRLHLPVL